MTFSIELHERFVEQAAWTWQAQRLLIESADFSPKSKILEVGCGTGAFLSSLNSISNSDYFGIDIQFNLLQFAFEHKSPFQLSCADANLLPFRDGTFDAIVCHYFLLWVDNISNILSEMRRVTRSGGIIAALAEPDYGSRIDYPPDFVLPGKRQREALIRQGANPDMGRQLGEALSDSGCTQIAVGILGSFNAAPLSSKQALSEQEILKSDLENEIDENTINLLIQKDTASRMNKSRVQFIPTFFGWGYNS